MRSQRRNVLLDWLLISSCIHCWTLCINVYAVTETGHKNCDLISQLYVDLCTMTVGRCDELDAHVRHIVAWVAQEHGQAGMGTHAQHMINANVTQAVHIAQNTRSFFHG